MEVLVETETKGSFIHPPVDPILWLFFFHESQKEMLLQLQLKLIMTKILKVVHTTHALYSESSDAIQLLCVRSRPAEWIKIQFYCCAWVE